MTSRNDSPTDFETLAAVARGDARAFERLTRRFHGRIARFALRVVDRHDIAEEVANDALMVVWRKAAAFEGRSSVSTWILGIAYRVALKARGRHARAPRTAPEDATIADEEGDDRLDRMLCERQVRTALSELPMRQRAMFELAYRYGYRLRDIADLLDCPTGTVKSRMFEVRSRLRATLSAPASDGLAA